jgi:hypothetical protein
MENTFNLKKFLAEGKLLKEEQTSNLEQINPDFTSDKIVTTSNYANDRGQLKSQFGKQSYDFGGSEDPIPNSIIVDDAEPEGDNEWIQFDLNKVGKFPPKKYINSTFTIDYIDNQNNLIKTILNSLESGGILVVSENVKSVSDFYNKLKNNFDILEVYDFMGDLNEGVYTPEERQEMADNIRKKYTINGVYYDPYYPLPPGLKYDNEMGGDGEDEEVDENSVISLILKKK